MHLENNEKYDWIREIFWLTQMSFLKYVDSRKLLKALSEGLLYGLWERCLGFGKGRYHSEAGQLGIATVTGVGGGISGNREAKTFSQTIFFSFIFLPKKV